MSGIKYGAGYLRNRVEKMVGSTFWVKKTMISSAVVQTPAADLTGVSTIGELALEDIIIKSDATGLATGTNIEIKTNNAKGILAAMVTIVSGLGGAVKSVDLINASVSHQQTILEVGKKLTINSTAADCDGSGTVDIYMKFRRLTREAAIAAA